jgi:serine/threonine protein kinase/ABC-type phosphate/phosphonate transport system substrate-binding protein
MPKPFCEQCGFPNPEQAATCPNCGAALAGSASERKSSPSTAPWGEDSRCVADYILGKQLGSGGMGVVYEARQISLNRAVALKLLRDFGSVSPAALRRFSIEAEAAARLRHPNIVRIHEIGEWEGQHFFSMDLVEGESLKEKIARGAFAITKSNARHRQAAIVRLIKTTALAVHHAHDRGVLHRDLKPANILIDTAGEPFLTDFGLAKIFRQTPQEETPKTPPKTEEVIGTPSYMSPEQASNSHLTVGSDIHGLGVIFYELLTGHAPFEGNTPSEILRKVVHQQPPSPRSLNPLIERDLETICLKCLEKDPRHRYSSAKALAEDLENWEQNRPIQARPAGPIRRTVQWVKRNPIGAAFMLSLLLGLSIALILLRVVLAQKEDIQAGQAVLFDEGINLISQIWKDPAKEEVTISSEYLATFDNRTPAYRAQWRPLTFGINSDGEPVAMAQGYARLLGYLEKNMSSEMREPVAFDLKLFKRFSQNSELIVQGRADFIVMTPVDYIHAKSKAPGITPIARATAIPEAVVFANAESGITRLEQLAGRSIIFVDPRYPLNSWAKAHLVDAGFFATDFQSSTHLEDRLLSPEETAPNRAPFVHSRWETRSLVLRGEFDASVGYKPRFEREKHFGLVELLSFQVTPDVIVAREEIGTNDLKAFRSALRRLPRDIIGSRISGEEFSAEWVEVEDSYFDELRAAMEKAERFDRGRPQATAVP